ncbi:choline-sulfatase [Uncinocarpus reesii 1704]|uniref:Choline-sulfatase n=1 Tax=Uncinocarpus reesii (strain UAMH 1704) TaxID=336963 RepID=C4JGC4_UNCRE|nr:choline-sulfatase [Uncinocarpus reesii 1704]EEP77673.1 choline-sulfatase [Uncinocarpus reesii 1704]
MDTTKKPNILYIMADQMAAPLLSIYNSSSRIKTPNIETLAESGVVFESAYCNSPLCAPSRFTMVSGQLPSRIGGYDNASDLPADTPTYSHYLRAQGYHTALSGKMHFAGPDQLHGYEERLTSDIYPGDYGWTVDWDQPELRKDWYHDMSSVMEAGPCVRSNQLDFDDEVVHKATQYLYDHVRYRTGQPFCLTVSMTHPHDPYTMTKDYWDMYEDVDIPLPQTPALPQDKLDPHSQRVMKIVDLWDREIPEERIKAARRAYFAACTYVDTQIGKLMTVLKNCGLADDTIVVFTGDHGDMLGEKGLWYKMVWYEMSARVPMIVSAPGKYQPKRVKENVSTMDLLPTFVAMSGGSVDPTLPLDGVSLMPYLDESSSGEKTDTVLGEYMAEGTLAPVVMIRRGPWKFIYSPIDPPMLFNVEADPTESTNLAEGIQLPSHHVAVKDSCPQAAAPPKPTGPAPLPTPVTSPSPQTLPVPFFSQSNTSNPAIFTPPRSPSPNKATTVARGAIKPAELAALLASFHEEVHARWDFKRIHQEVLHSQRRRRLVYSALIEGKITAWDYTPPTDGSQMYIRNVGQSALGNVEFLNRWPRVGREVQFRP